MRYYIIFLCLIFLLAIIAIVTALGTGQNAPDTPIVRLHPDKMPQDERLSYLWDTRTGVLLPEREPIFAQVLNASVPRNERHVIENRTQTELLISLDEFGSSQSTFLYRMNREQEDFLSYFWALEYERIWLVFSTSEGETILRGFNPDTGDLMQEYRYPVNFAWFDVDPNNEWLIFALPTTPIDRFVVYDITLVNLQTGETRLFFDTRYAEFSPTSEWLYFDTVHSINENQTHFQAIWFNLKTSEQLMRIIETDSIGGVWSSDSKFFVHKLMDAKSPQGWERISWETFSLQSNSTVMTYMMPFDTDGSGYVGWAQDTPIMYANLADNKTRYTLIVDIQTNNIVLLDGEFTLSSNGKFLYHYTRNSVEVFDNTGANIIQQIMPFRVFNIEFESLDF